jgi:acetyltransferase-like isoleucine patch superfamily enzyme
MRLLTWANLRWVLRHRAWTPYYLKRYWRYAVFRWRYPQVVLEGFVFLGKNIEVTARPGHGRLVIGKWVHLGDETRLRAHEGTLHIGDKVVFARDVTVNCYLDIEIGASTLIADWVYICDFDHKTEDIGLPIKDQGLAKSPVRIGPDCWLATKVTVLRGADIGQGSVIGANSVARGNIPEYSIAVGVPAVVVKDRVSSYAETAERRAYLDRVAVQDALALSLAGEPGDAEAPVGNGTGAAGDRADVPEGFSSYSPVGHYVPDGAGEETQRG